jgi:hypothetical protein
MNLMKHRLILPAVLATAGWASLAASARADIDLQITEIWPGQPGNDVTNDWVEITNFGNMPWVQGVSPSLRIDDSSNDVIASAAVIGISDILPGESVVVLMEGDDGDKTNFFDVWNPVKSQILDNIGFAGGSGLGLGQPSDGASIFLGGVLVDAEVYAGSTTSQSWDVLLGQYSTVGNPSGAVATLALGGGSATVPDDTPAIGSPGMIVPEPSSIALFMVGVAAVLGRSRRRR